MCLDLEPISSDDEKCNELNSGPQNICPPRTSECGLFGVRVFADTS